MPLDPMITCDNPNCPAMAELQRRYEAHARGGRLGIRRRSRETQRKVSSKGYAGLLRRHGIKYRFPQYQREPFKPYTPAPGADTSYLDD